MGVIRKAHDSAPRAFYTDRVRKLALGLLPLLFLCAQAGGTARPQSCLAKGSISRNVSCVWETPVGTLRIVSHAPDDIYLSALDRAGHTLWREQKVGIIMGIQVMDDVLVVHTNNNGAGTGISDNTALITSSLTPPTWVWGGPLLAQPARHAILFTQESVFAPDETRGLNFQRVTLRPKLSVTPIHFDSPTRPNCGEAQGFYDAFGQPTLQGQFISVKRRDRCGEFVTRFDWLTAPPAQQN